ncbi:conserved protein of unknown function (plasmid) [Cupriavidus neocaledonicus]|uniref:Uncharacterized protein n=1 Tax=Cupriavidus neocaledonicus TaxID=1040979 RepID=A0A375HU38_9BURK|nr:hypothetical protein CBM2605_B40016 [Cupriavidus neocaledonicus]SPD60985.1 conserved protein of unknown function [Cupriavidus neocaledonicus]
MRGSDLCPLTESAFHIVGFPRCAAPHPLSFCEKTFRIMKINTYLIEIQGKTKSYVLYKT